MTQEPLLQTLAGFVSEAWRMTADALAVADPWPLFAVWGLGFGAAEGLAWLDDRSAAAEPVYPQPHATQKA